MLIDFYQFVHNSLGIHFWELPTLLVAVILIVVLIVHSRNQKKREDDFEEDLKEKLEAIQNGSAEESAEA